MMRSARGHPGYWAFLGHRLSGLLLAIFLPMHFLVLGLALENAARLDALLRWSEQPLVKAAEWGLVMLFALHLSFGLRVLAIEFLPRWPGHLKSAIGLGVAAALLAGGAFLINGS